MLHICSEALFARRTPKQTRGSSLDGCKVPHNGFNIYYILYIIYYITVFENLRSLSSSNLFVLISCAFVHAWITFLFWIRKKSKIDKCYILLINISFFTIFLSCYMLGLYDEIERYSLMNSKYIDGD